MKQRIITSPVRLTGMVHPEQLASFVAVDALVRHCKEEGVEPPSFDVVTLAGDLAAQRAAQVALDLDDASDPAAQDLELHSQLFELEVEELLQALFDGLSIDTDVFRWRAGSEEAARVARIAFVRLFEAGLLVRSKSVLDSCPGCGTVVDETDVDCVERDVPVFRIAVGGPEEAIHLNLARPELLVGAVAVGVPVGFTSLQTVELPLLDAEVPVVEVEGLGQPILVVPGHDALSWEIAKAQGFLAKQVLDGDGVVRVEGPLQDMGAQSARLTAVETLSLSGALVQHAEGRVEVRECHRCHSELIPLLGSRWILPMSSLEGAVVAAVDEGLVRFSTSNAFHDFVAAANRNGAWVLSQSLWNGVKVPISDCLDCGGVSVSVEQATSCGTCMGTLQPHQEVIDGRFVAALTPLVMSGWPGSVEDEAVTLVVGRNALETWAVPVAALGLALANKIPFQQVVIENPDPRMARAEPQSLHRLVAQSRSNGAEVMRVALMTANPDKAAAKSLVQMLNNPPVGYADVNELRAALSKSLQILDAEGALGMLSNAAQGGISGDQRREVLRLVAPLLGKPSVGNEVGR